MEYNLLIGRIKIFGLEYVLAFIKVVFQIGFAIVSAIPFRIA